jgi:hypothetical protein
MEKPEIKALLRSLRNQAIAAGASKLGSHQLNAHWSLAYACDHAPEPWEIYRVRLGIALPAISTVHAVLDRHGL